MTVDADAIADCVLATFDSLPEKRNPRPRSDGSREWVPLAGIVLSKAGKLSCVSLGTGMKCLPYSKLPLANGNVLHDWHAEVLAIRSFNRFLLDQCLLISTPPYPTSPWIQSTAPFPISSTTEAATHDTQPFTIPPDVTIHMYCSEAPCGDASMELVMQSQVDATPWTTAVPTVDGALRGRANFDLLGAVRCKPSRPDAPPTLSKSCTDKLALKQGTSLFSSTTSLLISPRNAYLGTLVLPESQYVPAACERAFGRSGRLKHMSIGDEKWMGGYAWESFSVVPTKREFGWSRKCVPEGQKAVPSNLSAIWTPAWQETLIGGVLQGRKQFDARGASKVCRRSIWRAAVQVAGLVGVPVIQQILGKRKYGNVKGDGVFGARKKVKSDVIDGGLKGWVKNAGDDGWTLEDRD